MKAIFVQKDEVKIDINRFRTEWSDQDCKEIWAYHTDEIRVWFLTSQNYFRKIFQDTKRQLMYKND